MRVYYPTTCYNSLTTFTLVPVQSDKRILSKSDPLFKEIDDLFKEWNACVVKGTCFAAF